jgi:putative transposase
MNATVEANKAKPAAKSSGHKALGKGRVSIPGQAYLLTTVTLFRRPVFLDFEEAKAAASVHNMKWVWRDSQCLAWVLMPDHWHGLIVLGENDHLHTLMGRFKMASSKKVNEKYKTNGWLWGRGYHDHALRTNEALRDAGRYVVANHLRAGIVDDLGMYPFWNAVWLDPKDPLSALA